MKLIPIVVSILVFILLNSCDKSKKDINLIESYTINEILPNLIKTDSILKCRRDTISNSLIQLIESENSDKSPLFSILKLNERFIEEEFLIDGESTILGYIIPRDTSLLFSFLRDEKIKLIFPKDIQWRIIRNNNSFNLRLFAFRSNSNKNEIDDSIIKEITLKPTGLFNVIGMLREDAINKGLMQYEVFIKINKELLKDYREKSSTLLFKVDAITYSCTIPSDYYENGDLIFIDVFEKENLIALKTKYKEKIVIK